MHGVKESSSKGDGISSDQSSMSTTVPVFVQPDSEQECLLRSNVLPALGISVVRANGQKLTASIENEAEPDYINLVQSVTIPSQKDRFVKGQIEGDPSKSEHLLFEPKHESLEPLGLLLKSLYSLCIQMVVS